MKKTILIILIVILVLPCTVLAISPDKVLRVGVYNDRPTLFIDENNKAAGLSIDVLEDFANKYNYELEYVHGPLSEQLKRIESGDIDVLPDLFYTNRTI